MENANLENNETPAGDETIEENLEDLEETLEGTLEENLEETLKKNTNLENIVLALLFAADEPLSVRRMAAIVEDSPVDDIKKAIDNWQRRIAEESWSIAIERVAGGYQLSTRIDYAPYIGRLYSGKRKFRLSKAGLETLAIIAYKQPITRAEIENVRGVGSGGVVTNLMERSLIKIVGKAKVLGAPFLYGSTPEFLEYLGLNSLKDLPSMEELEALLEKEAYPESAVEGEEVMAAESGEETTVGAAVMAGNFEESLVGGPRDEVVDEAAAQEEDGGVPTAPDDTEEELERGGAHEREE